MEATPAPPELYSMSVSRNAIVERVRARLLTRRVWVLFTRVLFTWALLAWAQPVSARTVGIVNASGSDAAVTETLTRVHGELLAVGLQVRALERDPRLAGQPGESREWLAEQHETKQLDAVIVVVADGSSPAVEVWTFESRARPLRVAKVELEPGTSNAPEKLAIRAIDVLRSAFLEYAMEKRLRSEPGESSSAPVQDSEVRVAAEPVTLGLALGVATLTGLDGVGPAIMPLARADLRLRQWLTLQLAAAGLGSRPHIDGSAHGAELGQSYALLGARYRFVNSEHWYPFLGMSVGVLSTSVEGIAEPPARAHAEHVTTLLLEGTLGADWNLSDRYYSSLTAHVHMTQPSAAVYVLDELVATTGRPNLAISLSFGAWL